jgi:hypothetical protein
VLLTNLARQALGYSHLLEGVGRATADAAMVPRSVPSVLTTSSQDPEKRTWPFAQRNERPGQQGCAARDLNPQPAD